MKRAIFLILTVLNSLLVLLFAMMTAVGSLELFPTLEQIEKGTIAYFSVFLFFAGCEIFLLRKLAKLYLH